MELQTRRQILDIWRATIEHCYIDGQWVFGGRDGRNSISDAEQLLTILYPATVIPSLKVDSVDQIADDVLDNLRPLGNAMDIPRRFTAFVTDFMRTYQVDGTPDFSGGSYFDIDTEDEDEAAASGAQLGLHVVDSYSMSVTLCLAILGFTRVYRQDVRSPRTLAEIKDLEDLASQRLTAAMVGLLRSFTVNTFDTNEEPGETMSRMINQTGVANEVLTHNLLAELAEIRASLKQELTLGLGQVAEDLDNPGRLFECGWSWGVVEGAPLVDFVDVGEQQVGIADARPYLYFTVVALDGIQDLFSERTRILGLLNDDQQRISRALHLRWDLTRQFWAKVATFGGRRWPLEDVPWMTSDGRESDYYSVLLTSIVLEGVGSEKVANIDVARIGRLLDELASRGRITRRPTKQDPAIGLHSPGMQLRLIGSQRTGGPRLLWTVSSYSLLVLKRLLRVAELLDDTTARIKFLDLADEIWNHIERRRIDDPKLRGLWDQPGQAFTDVPLKTFTGPSWYHTERVVEVLVAAANVTDTAPTATSELTTRAEQLLAEAEHIFDRELLRGTTDAGEKMREIFQVVGANLRRARELLRDRPGTAGVLAGDVLRELDTVDAARQDTTRMS